MKERLKRLAPKVAYPAFYLLCLLVCLSWTFPYEKLRDRIVATFNAQQQKSQNPQQLFIDELDSSWITGVKATGVRIVSPSTDPSKPGTEIKLDEARARISLLPLILGNKNVSFRIDAFGGEVSGTFEDTGKARSVDVELEGIDLSKVEAIAQSAGFPLAGALNGKLTLDLPEGKASKANGKVTLEIRDMFAGTEKELALKTPLGPFTLPRLKIGTVNVDGEAKDGVLKIAKVSASGGDVDVTGDGRVQLRENAGDANMDVALKFKINDGYRSKSDKTKLLFGAPGAKEKPMLEMDPRMAKAKTADGFYGLAVRGTLARPDIAPSGGAIPVPGIGGAPSFK